MSLPPSLVEFASGDEAAARLTYDNLAALRDQLADHPDQAALSRDVEAVLAGRMSMRALAAVPEFRTVVHRGMRQAQEAWNELDPDERRALVRDGVRRVEETTPPD